MPKVEEKPRGKLAVMGPEGHAEIVWDAHDFDSVSHAKKMYDDLIAKGYNAFAVHRKLKPDDSDPSKEIEVVEKGVKVKKFDPTAAEIIMVPPVSGG